MMTSQKKPVIGITGNSFGPDPARDLFKKKHLQCIEREMILGVVKAGGLPFLIPNTYDSKISDELVAQLDGLLLSGGTDISPLSYKEEPMDSCWPTDRERDKFEFHLIKKALESKIPVLGICRGCQVINVYFGGTLYQDILTQIPKSNVHRDSNVYDGHYHRVLLEKNSRLFSIYGKEELHTNSVHHQSIKDVGNSLKVTARTTEDNIVEAIEADGSPDYPFLMGVQWHIEWCHDEHPDLDRGEPVMKAFIDAC